MQRDMFFCFFSPEHECSRAAQHTWRWEMSRGRVAHHHVTIRTPNLPTRSILRRIIRAAQFSVLRDNPGRGETILKARQYTEDFKGNANKIGNMHVRLIDRWNTTMVTKEKYSTSTIKKGEENKDFKLDINKLIRNSWLRNRDID